MKEKINEVRRLEIDKEIKHQLMAIFVYHSYDKNVRYYDEKGKVPKRDAKETEESYNLRAYYEVGYDGSIRLDKRDYGVPEVNNVFTDVVRAGGIGLDGKTAGYTTNTHYNDFYENYAIKNSQGLIKANKKIADNIVGTLDENFSSKDISTREASTIATIEKYFGIMGVPEDKIKSITHELHKAVPAAIATAIVKINGLKAGKVSGELLSMSPNLRQEVLKELKLKLETKDPDWYRSIIRAQRKSVERNVGYQHANFDFERRHIIDITKNEKLPDDLKGLTGDRLKASILLKIHSKLKELVKTYGDPDKLKEILENGDGKDFKGFKQEIAILKKSQGLATKLLSPLGLKTDSFKAYEALIQTTVNRHEAEENIAEAEKIFSTLNTPESSSESMPDEDGVPETKFTNS